jgi:hypothetical protein
MERFTIATDLGAIVIFAVALLVSRGAARRRPSRE